ncbi:MAG: ImmA/IrrE family metallo-endopeptidase [Methylococcales bacterium]
MPVVNPQILVWARKSAGYDLADAAKKLQLNDTQSATGAEKLAAFESGAKPPSRSLLVRMAKQYRRPLLTFYLSEPPALGDRGEDYRTLSHDIDPSQNAIVDALVRNIKARQEIVREALISERDRQPLRFVGSYSMDNGVYRLVSLIKETAGIELDVYRAQRNQDEAFKYLRGCIENTGVFSLLAGNLGSHHTNLNTEIFRGFALSDTIAPFVIVNDQDAKTAWSATLLHEVAHLWLGATGISGDQIERRVERFCNEVASELLLPGSELTADLILDSLYELDGAVREIDSYASSRKVSSRLVAFRLFQRHAISQEFFNSLNTHFYERWRSEKDKQKEKAQRSPGGPDYYVLKRLRVGNALVETSERLLRSRELSTTEVATVLGVRALKVGSMFSEPKAP